MVKNRKRERGMRERGREREREQEKKKWVRMTRWREWAGEAERLY